MKELELIELMAKHRIIATDADGLQKFTDIVCEEAEAERKEVSRETSRADLSAPSDAVEELALALQTQSVLDHAICYASENALPSVKEWAKRDLLAIEHAARLQLKRQGGK